MSAVMNPVEAISTAHPPESMASPDQPRIGPLRVAMLWLASRVLLMSLVVVLAAAANVRPQQQRWLDINWYLSCFSSWDSTFYQRIARGGYLPPKLPCCDQVFFPGYPFGVRLLSMLTGGNLQIAGILLSVLAGSVAAGLIWYLGWITTADTRIGANAALFLAIAPYGMFFSVLYTESFFLMFCLGSWAAASRQKWWLAGVLGAGAASVRINGLFLLAALAVMYLVQLRASRRWRPRRDVLALGLPLLPVIGYFTWLHHRTGSWHAWSDAQTKGWGRHIAPPWTGLQAGFTQLSQAHNWHVQLSAAADLLAVAGGLALIVVLIRLRRWPEVTYMVPSVLVLICSTMLVSSARYALVWFPGYLLLAQLSVRPHWRYLRPVLVVTCLPLLVLLAFMFADHSWVA